MISDELILFAKKYEEDIEKWIKEDRFDEEWYRRKIAEQRDELERAKFLRRTFRAAVTMDFWRFTMSVGAPVDRNKGYRTYIDRIDRENVEIGRLDRLISIKLQHIRERDELIAKREVGSIMTHERMRLDELNAIIAEEEPVLHELQDKRNKLREKRPNITLCMIPRGLLKTTIFQAHRALWYYLRDSVNKKQSPIIFLLHSVVDKANETLDLIKQVAELPHIVYAFSDVLKKTKDRVDRLSFNDFSLVMRKEDHFMTGSVGMDFGGEHATYYFVDDAVLDDNTDTEDKNKKVKKWFHKLRWLDDHSGDFRIEMVGTHYYDDSLYCDLLKYEEDVDIVSWVQGATTELEDGTAVYNFPEVYSEEHCKTLQRTTPIEQYLSQVEMIPQPRKKELNLVEGVDFIVVDGEDGFSLEYILKRGGRFVVKDMAYSAVGKKEGDAKSRDVTLSGVFFNGVMYIVDESQLLGGDNETIYAPLKRQVQKHDPYLIIVDSQGTQMNIAKSLRKKLFKEFGTQYKFDLFKGTQRASSAGKAERIMSYLAERFRMGEIKILNTCYKTIAEIERRSRGFDHLDCLVMAATYDFNSAESVLFDKQQQRDYARKVLRGARKSSVIKRRNSNVINRTTGY